jgi:hypothetical protein
MGMFRRRSSDDPQPPRPSGVPAGQRAAMLSNWPVNADGIQGWTGTEVYLFQDAHLADPASYQNRQFGPGHAMIYLMGWRAGRRGVSAKLPPWDVQVYQYAFEYEVYLGGLIDGVADAVQGTDRVPDDIRKLYPDYRQIDAGGSSPSSSVS